MTNKHQKRKATYAPRHQPLLVTLAVAAVLGMGSLTGASALSGVPAVSDVWSQGTAAQVDLLITGAVPGEVLTLMAEPEEQHHEERLWSVNLDDFRAQASSSDSVEVLLGDWGLQQVALNEYELFAPGEKKVTIYNDNGTVESETPLEIWTYRGNALADPFSKANLVVDLVGVYGSVTFNGILYDFEPAVEDAKDKKHKKDANDTKDAMAQSGNATVLVRWIATPIDAAVVLIEPLYESIEGAVEQYLTPDGAEGFSAPPTIGANAGAGTGTGGGTGGGSGGGSGGGCPRGCGYITMDVQGVADKYFRDASASWSSRIAAAFAAQTDMWFSYAGISFVARGIVGWPNMSTSDNCGTQVYAFDNFVGSGRDSTVESYQLFTGKNLAYPTIGCANAGYGNRIAVRPFSVVQMVTEDSYTATSSTDVGLVSAHEIGHTWSLPHDSSVNSNGKYNIMKHSYCDCEAFWLTSAQIQSVRDAGRYSP